MEILNYSCSGINDQLIFPQFHGREHLNIFMWLDLLKSNKDIQIAFDYNCFALSFNNSKSIKIPYLAAFHPYNNVDINDYIKIINSGLVLFNEKFGFFPNTFIPPIYTLAREIEPSLTKLGIKALQGLPIQNLPYSNKKFYRFLKIRNHNNQVQLIRNCFFEPSTNLVINWVDTCIREIEIAFNNNKPAIICTHRLNYMGGLVMENRERNLNQLSSLIKTALNRWMDIEFMTNDSLVTLINNDLEK
jgi:hypothetical protein